MWIEEPFYKYIIAVILVLLTTLLLYYNLPIFYLILWFLAAIFLPILFSTLFYYILRPSVNFWGRWVPRYVAILIVYAMVALAITVMTIILVPQLAEAINHLSADKFDSLKEHFSRLTSSIKEYIPFTNIPFFEKLLFDNLPKINAFVYQFIAGLFTAITGIAIAIGLTPFMLFYFLRDDSLLSRFILRFVPQKFQIEVTKIMQDIDGTLAGFISAQATIALIVGGFLFLGYVLIGIPYPLSLAIFAMLFYIIPFIGTFLAIIPALLVAISINFTMTFRVLIVMLIAHLIEANLVTPRLTSNKLKIHPLTVILLLLVGGSLFGVLGLILITPAYAIIKVLIWNIYKISRLHYQMAKIQSTLDGIKEEGTEPATGAQE